MALKYSNKINKIRSVALGLIFAGMIIMYIGLFFRETEWLMLIFMFLGIVAIGLSTVIYFWIGMLSTKAVPVECPECGKQTKMLGRVDACMFCKQPLTLDRNLEGKEFDEKYNSKKYTSEEQKES
ncbi:YgzB family protein [Alkalibacillus haloalkaliphilus]|uniref:YgzB family protein n=1 Tax=Alkalibacillus haloalkaliphilus TaxID=94136 RepID=UPI000307F992|nr:YgzB family protein [Alkalibacillus haloalkaliphilus]